MSGLAPCELPSVTTLIDEGMGTAPGIVGWNKRLIAEAAVDDQDVLAPMLARGDRDAAVDYLKGAPWRATTRAKIRGTELHKIFELEAKGQKPTIPPGAEPYVAQWRNWLDRYQPEFLMSEAPVFNPEYGYAGTSDGVMRLQGYSLVFDYKTNAKPPWSPTKRPPHSEVALQLVAYRRAPLVLLARPQRSDDERDQDEKSSRRFYTFDPTLDYEPMPATDGALAVVVTPYDVIAAVVRTDEEIWRTFLHVAGAAQFRLKQWRTVFGVALPAAIELREVAS